MGLGLSPRPRYSAVYADGDGEGDTHLLRSSGDDSCSAQCVARSVLCGSRVAQGIFGLYRQLYVLYSEVVIWSGRVVQIAVCSPYLPKPHIINLRICTDT